MDPYFTEQSAGRVAHLGAVSMRLLLPAEKTNRALSAGEFSGAAGAWTVPHVHQQCEEFFYVIDGVFQFTCGGQEIEARAGSMLMVPRGTTHMFTAQTNGRILALWTPGGLEQMFLELSGKDLTDRATRADIAKRWDSVPA